MHHEVAKKKIVKAMNLIEGIIIIIKFINLGRFRHVWH